MRVTGVRTRAEPDPDFDRVIATGDLDMALPEAEFVVLACPLTPQTTGLMSRARLAMLPHGACLLNLGRGALLDQDALCDLLETGHLAGAILDVTTPEPPPPGHRLWHTRNLVLTPHCSADSPLTYNCDSLAIFMANLRAIEAGTAPPNRVDVRRGY
jgi:phosphoglycerate dehydrogenase-like enzyme